MLADKLQRQNHFFFPCDKAFSLHFQIFLLLFSVEKNQIQEIMIWDNLYNIIIMITIHIYKQNNFNA